MWFQSWTMLNRKNVIKVIIPIRIWYYKFKFIICRMSHKPLPIPNKILCIQFFFFNLTAEYLWNLEAHILHYLELGTFILRWNFSRVIYHFNRLLRQKHWRKIIASIILSQIVAFYSYKSWRKTETSMSFLIITKKYASLTVCLKLNNEILY